jgi:hypothetical protein
MSICAAAIRRAECRKRVKLSGKDTFSTRPVMPKDRTLPTLIGSSEACQDTSVRRPLEFRDRVEVVDPRLLRANKYLPAWHQFISLAKRSKAHVVGFWLVASRCRIDRRPAVRAEGLQTDVSTFGGLSIFRRFAGRKHERAWMSDDDRSQWSAAHGLAICAVANGRRFGIGFGLERHVAAVTAPIDASMPIRQRGMLARRRSS